MMAAGKVEEHLVDDPRWQLVERIVATEPFRRSARFRDLLRYLAECAISNRLENLTETKIGCAVFGKSPDYSPTEDSTVRVHVRQLRLKLHEYFNVMGREDSLILEIPKGGFVPVFREVAKIEHPSAEPGLEILTHKEGVGTTSRSRTVGSLLSVIAVLLAVIGYLAFRLSAATPHCPWPLSIFTHSNEPVAIVTADVNFGLINILEQKRRTLEEYLTRDAVAPPERESEPGLLSYLGRSSLTSSADAVVAAGISRLMSNAPNQIAVRSARDLHPRDLDYGNFIFLGSPRSNPWVSEFVDKTNFQEEEDPDGSHVWRNKSPRPGEQSSYKCLRETGSTGDDYADIALVPGHSGRGYVLILQGCQQEGTESTLLFLKGEKYGKALMQALAKESSSGTPVYFEALIKTLVIAGAPNSTQVVATRVINP